MSRDLATRGRRLRMLAPGGGVPHFCFPLVDPRWVPAAEAQHMRPDDPVLGLESGRSAWALPWWIMKNHHIANLELEGRAILVTLCEACSSGAAFDPVIDGRRHTFRLEGLYNGTIMPRDYETESRWTGFTGEAIEGPMAGRTMERLPLLQCTWEEWLALRPASLVPDGRGESRTGHGEGHFPGGPVVSERFRGLLEHVDRRLPHYELVLGVAAGGAARCYPLGALDASACSLDDRLGDAEIAVFWRPNTWMASAYERRVEGRDLSFRSEAGAIFDKETGSRWEISGVAVAGPLSGRQLKYLHSGVEEFHIWAAFHPQTSIHGGGRDAKLWSADAVPSAVRTAIEKWWPPGCRLLDIGSGEGVVSAWAAESNLKVLGVDEDRAAVERARRSFGRLPNLAFEVLDLRSATPEPGGFDAIVDCGLLHRLSSAERPAYLANVAAAAKPGARFLALVPAAPERAPKLVEALQRFMQREFHFVDSSEATLPDPSTGQGLSGIALRFVRRGWLA